MNEIALLGAVLWGYMTLFFCLSLLFKRNDLADVAWGLGFVLLSWIALFLRTTFDVLFLLPVLFVSIWGLRLSWHIFRRLRKHPEDPRYAAWRKEWTWFTLRSYFQVYMLQGLLLFIIVSPVLYFVLYGTPVLPCVLAGALLWTFGFLFESIGDAQLAYFLQKRTDPTAIMQSGLWKYTRHPNYFGESCMWWGLWILSFGAPMWLVLLISPVTITSLLLFVSGVPMMENRYKNNAAYQRYAAKTSVFIPWFPKT